MARGKYEAKKLGTVHPSAEVDSGVGSSFVGEPPVGDDYLITETSRRPGGGADARHRRHVPLGLAHTYGLQPCLPSAYA